MQANSLKQRKTLSRENVCLASLWLTEEHCNSQLERASRKIVDWHNKLRQPAEPGRTQAEGKEKKKKKKLLLQLFKAPQEWMSYGVTELSTGVISRQSPKKEQLLVHTEETISVSPPPFLVFSCLTMGQDRLARRFHLMSFRPFLCCHSLLPNWHHCTY